MTQQEVRAAMGSLGLIHPPIDWKPIELDDDEDLPYVARALLNRGTETVTVAVYMIGSPSTVREVVIPAGQYLEGLFTRVLEEGTTENATLSGAE